MVEVPIAVVARESSALRELVQVLRLVDSGTLKASAQTHRPAGRTVEAVSAVLEGGDFDVAPRDGALADPAISGPIRAFGWLMVLEAGGLAQLVGTRLELTSRGRKAVARSSQALLEKLWKAWLRTRTLDEVERLDPIHAIPPDQRPEIVPLARRRATLERALSACPVGLWIPVDGFFRFSAAIGEAVEVAGDFSPCYVDAMELDSLFVHGEGELLDHRYVLCVLLEYAATLGLIDVALVPRPKCAGTSAASSPPRTTSPPPLSALLADATHRTTSLADAGQAHIIHCADAELGALLAADPVLSALGVVYVEPRLFVPTDAAAAFDAAVHALEHRVASALQLPTRRRRRKTST